MSSSSTTSAPPRGGSGSPVTLTAGIYVAARRLAMGFPASMGAHQFVFSIPEYHCFSQGMSLPRHHVVLMAAYNVGGRLRAQLGAPSDSNALRQYFQGRAALQVARVRYSRIDSGIRQLLQGVRRYVTYEAAHHITYPANGGATLTGCATRATYNSNSWAQSLVHHRLGVGLVTQDFDGIDICNANRIPAVYFR